MRDIPMLRRFAAGAGLALALLAGSGCGHHKTTANIPPARTAPPPYVPPPPPPRTTKNPSQTGRIPITPIPENGVSADDLEYVATHQPIYSEEGAATWYSAPYKGRKAANGQVFSDYALTAAHRTLPMGSLIVVTNMKTGRSSAMRISDRGPFAPDKIIDLTIASAKATDVYYMGLARVRVDVYQTPKPMETGGRWCVQIGAFTSESKANKLKEQLLRRYPDSRVIEFPGVDSFWVRIRPQGDDRDQAEAIARWLHPSEGGAYLTRLD